MTPSQDLFQLIQRMSRAEKRYFTLQASATGESKHYVILFEELDKMEEHDEEALKKRLIKKGIKVKQLHVLKNYLYHFILKSLRSFNEQKTTDQKLLTLLAEAGILQDKGLYEQCQKILNSAEKIAVKHEKYLFLIEILIRMIYLNLDWRSENVEKYIMGLHEKIDDARKKIGNETTYLKYSNQFLLWARTNKQADIAKSDLINHPLLKDESMALTPFSKIFFNFSHGAYMRSKRDIVSANEFFKKMLDNWHENPHFLHDNSKMYKAHLANYLGSCMDVKKFDVFENRLKEFESIPDQSYHAKAATFRNYYYISLYYLLNAGKWNEAIRIVPAIEKGLIEYEATIPMSRIFIFCSNIAILFFMLEKWDHSLRWLNKIPVGKKIEPRKDVQVYARVFKLIIYYEMGFFNMFDDLYQSVYRGLKNENRLLRFERLMLSFIRELHRSPTEKVKRAVFEDYKSQLTIVTKDPSTPRIIGLQDVMIWIENKLTGRPMVEILRSETT